MPHFEVSHFSPPGVGEGRATKSRSLAGGTHTGTAGRETGRASRPVPTGRVTAPAKTFSGKRPTVGVSGFARSSLISRNPLKKYEHRSWRTRAAQKRAAGGFGPRAGRGLQPLGWRGRGQALWNQAGLGREWRPLKQSPSCAPFCPTSQNRRQPCSAGADTGRRQENEVLNQAALGGCSVLISPAASQAAGNLQNKGRFPPGLLTARFPPLPRETGRNRLCVAPCSE